MAMNMQDRSRTGNQALVREINLAMVMNHVRTYTPVSRATVAELTGLNKTTVSSLVQELLEYRFLRETGLSSSAGTGRPAVMLDFNPAGGCFVSGEIGVDFISVISTDFTAEIICQYREPTSPLLTQSEILDRALTLLGQAAEAGQEQVGPILGVALGVPGLVDQAGGTLLFAPNLKWHHIPLRDMLQSHFTAPIFVDNEANLAALGEHYFGAAKNHTEVLYISAGVGLGGGIIRDGHLFSGGTGFGGEFGHMTMDPAGELCNCGNRGCWETQVSQSALFRYVWQAIISQGQSSMLTAMTHGDLTELTVAQVVEAAQAGDAVSLAALETLGRYLGIGMAALVNALNPHLIVFGGILSLAADFLLPIVTAEIHQHALSYLWGETTAEVALARHGVDACVMGGVAACYQSILNQPAAAAARIGLVQ
jgi:glucokinase-like ROK family protein